MTDDNLDKEKICAKCGKDKINGYLWPYWVNKDEEGNNIWVCEACDSFLQERIRLFKEKG